MENSDWNKLIKSPELIDLFIAPRERGILIKKLHILEALKRGRSYKEISEELWVSPQTIRDLKKAIDKKTYQSYASGYRRMKLNQRAMLRPERKRLKRYRKTKYGKVPIPD